MKRYWCVLLLVGVCWSVDGKAQAVKFFSPASIIQPYKLEVGFNKTTHLVFPLSIVSIDRGSAGILAQKATGVENILKVKADQKAFEETNLSVITSDGKLYSFLVCYNESPADLNINLDSALEQRWAELPGQKTVGILNEALLAHYAKLALAAEGNMHRLRTKAAKVSFSMDGNYVKESALFLRLRLENKSTINYDIEGLRLFVRDKVQGKRTAVQERDLVPLLVEGDATRVAANSTQNIVLALPTFMIPRGKYLAIELTEEGGGRNLLLKVKGKFILKAQPLE